MNRSRILDALLRTCCFMVAALCVSVAGAQETPQAPLPNGAPAPAQPLSPLPDGRSGDSNSATIDTSDARAETQPQPDTHVLSSAANIGLGSLRRLGQVFDPALQVSEFGESGIAGRKIVSVTSAGGSLDVHHYWKWSVLSLSYRGAETFYQPSYYYYLHNLPYHNGAISDEISAGRWIIRLENSIFYSWGPAFGSVFAGGPAEAGQTRDNLQQFFNSLQGSFNSGGTIQTYARELSNSSIVEIDYARTRRTTFTVVGSFGLLHFLDRGFISNQNLHGRIGYNHSFGAKNSLGLTYDHSRIIFPGSPSRIQIDLVQLAFGRKVTGRLAFQVSGGPQRLAFGHLGPSQKPQLTWSASAGLTYEWRRTGFSLSYFRGVTPGSGIFFGSKSQVVRGTATRQFRRIWSLSANAGYARNNVLAPNIGFTGNFDNWFAGANVSRPLKRQFHLGLVYGFEQQTSGPGKCPVASCGLGRSFSQYGVSLAWHPLFRGPA
jgi:hypothetical protein